MGTRYINDVLNLDEKQTIKSIVAEDIVDNLTSVETSKYLSAKQGQALKGFIDNINTLLTSNDTTLDELQEIVDFIKINKATLDTLGISNIAGLQTALDALQTNIDAKAPLNSPILTGTPQAPTPTVGDNSTKIATTAFVLANAGGTLNLSAGAYRFFYSQTIKNTTSTSFVKVFEFKVNFGGSCRIKFGLKCSTSFAWAYATIYKNGVAVGTARSTWNNTYTYFSEDILGISDGDLIQIYAKVESGYTASVTDVSFASASPAIIGEAI